MKKTDYDYIARVEKEISKKFGKDTIKNPHAGWDEDKEEKYIEDCKIFQRKIDKNRESDDMIEHNGFLISKKLITVTLIGLVLFARHTLLTKEMTFI